MDTTQKLARYCDRMDFDRFPEEVIDRAKYLFLDFIAVTVRGSQEQSSQTMHRFVRGVGRGTGGGVIIGTDEKAPHVYAALANGTSSHAVEMDDVNNEASLHPGVVVFPAALATGEMVGAAGKRFLEAVVLGYEVMVRLGRALGPAQHYGRGFHPTGTCGVFGASVAASKIMGLKADGMVNAMGISGSQAAGSMEFLAQGAWTKRFHAGWAAHSGMMSAQLAQEGFRGPSSIIEGRDGFLRAYSDGADESKVLEGIDSQFGILQTSVKPHACCRYMQPPIDSVLEIIRENDLRPDDVEKVTVGVLQAGFPLVVEPEEIKRQPHSIVDAQFSMPFGVAVAVLYRKAGLEEFQLSKIRSEEVKGMMERVVCVQDPDLETTYPKQWRATAEILTRSGERHTASIDYPKGDPENPLSWEEMIEKFHDLVGRRIPRGRRLEIIQQVRGLEKIPNIQKWSHLLLRTS